MVHLKKSLVALFIALCFSFSLSSQAVESAPQKDSVVASDFESDASYFQRQNSGDNESSDYSRTSSVGIIVRVVLVLVFIAAAIYGIMWFFRKRNGTGSDSDDFLRRVSSISVGQGRSVEVVTLLDRAYVIGVTDSSITLLDKLKGEKDAENETSFDDRELVEAMNLNYDRTRNAKKPMNFMDVLNMFMPGSRSKGSVYNTESQDEQEKE